MEVDPKRAPLTRKAFELYATGEYGLERLEATMADLGLTTRATPKHPERPVTFKWLHRMLRDQYYLGYVNYKGDVFKGRHKPIVDQELFDRVQEVADLRSRGGQRDRVLQHYLKGMLFCARCERSKRTSRLIYTEARGRSGKRYAYFLCRGRQDGVCDLPHLPADRVEDAIVDHYSTLGLPASFVAEVRTLLEDAVADEQRSVTEVHAALNRKIKELDSKEDRLLDLLADDGIPQAKVKAKLPKIQADRAAAEAGLANAAAEIAVGAGVLLEALDLVSHPDTFYRDGNDTIRRNLNQTFYQHFYVDEHGVQASRQNPPFADFHAAHALTKKSRAATTPAGASSNANRDLLAGVSERHVGDDSSSDLALSLADILSSTGSSKNTLVELRGIEPLTYSMRTSRATNCAIAPCRSGTDR